jgi:hypothetical protein
VSRFAARCRGSSTQFDELAGKQARGWNPLGVALRGVALQVPYLMRAAAIFLCLHFNAFHLSNDGRRLCEFYGDEDRCGLHGRSFIWRYRGESEWHGSGLHKGWDQDTATRIRIATTTAGSSKSRLRSVFPLGELDIVRVRQRHVDGTGL